MLNSLDRLRTKVTISWRQHTLEWLVLLLIIGFSAFLRLYNVPQSLSFLGDQGRDALLVARIWKQHDPVLIGPVTSLGNMYLGPLYYYFMLPWLWLSYPSPAGPALAVGVLGVLTVGLMYLWGRDLFDRKTGLLAAALLAANTVAVVHSRFSWNPNPEPLFGLLVLWACYKAITKSVWYWVVVSVGLAVLTQLHYMSLLLLPCVLLVWLFQVSSLRFKKLRTLFDVPLLNISGKLLLLSSLVSVAVYAVSLLPLLVFDMLHAWPNAHAFYDILFGQNALSAYSGTAVEHGLKILQETRGRAVHLLANLFLPKNYTLNSVLVGLLLLGAIAFMYAIWRKARKAPLGMSLVLLFLGVGILGTSVYSHSVFDHYLLFLLPAATLLIAWVLGQVWRMHLVSKILISILLLMYVVLNVSQISFISNGPSVSLLSNTAHQIANHLGQGERYNIVLLSATHDINGQSYRYFLDTIPGKEPLNPEHDDVASANTLVIINEERVLEDELSSPIYEIVVFGLSPIKEKDVFVTPENIKVTILRK